MRCPTAPAARWLAACLLLAPLAASAQLDEVDADLGELSLEALMDVQITSASKRQESLADTAAAVYVITSEDIRRSGATSIPELLRGVPGLHVAQLNANTWQITARGFNDQFANKLLVMIDGRSVYTPLFSGTFWDVQDTVLEDIERIEVVRGPGGTLWGANAVNGVINIITRSAAETQGLLISGGGGNRDRAISTGRYGGAIGESFHYRGYLKYTNRADFDSADGVPANDEWSKLQGGFRIDTEIGSADSLTVQGDYYGGDIDTTTPGLAPMPNESDVSGGNLLARWTHRFGESSVLQVQTYYDRTERSSSTLDEDRNTFDLTVEHQVQLFDIHDVVWGLGYRLLNDQNIGDPMQPVFLSPASRLDNLFSAFVQDRIEMFDDRLQLTVGTKIEHNDYSGFEVQPSARLLFRPDERQRLWTAVSRAVRTPSRVEHDVTILTQAGPGLFATLTGDPSFDSEKLVAFEAGYRIQPIDRLSVDLAAYYNYYDQLRSSTLGAPIVGFPGPMDVTVPVGVANAIDAHGWGAELSTRLRATSWWTLLLNYTYMQLSVNDDDGITTGLVDPVQESTPRHQVQLGSQVDLPWGFELDGSLAWVDQTNGGAVSDYLRLDTRFGWRPRDDLEISIVGQNLTNAAHAESLSSSFTQRTLIPRSVYGTVAWRW